MQAWVTAAIGVGGTLAGTGLGAGLGYRGALSISRRQRADAQRARVRDALAEYLGALYVSVGELHDLPQNQPPGWLNQLLDEVRGEQRTWVARRAAEHRLTGDRYRDVAGRLAMATAKLHVLPLQTELENAVAAANQYAEKLGSDRSDEIISQWTAVRSRLLASAAYLNVEGRE